MKKIITLLFITGLLSLSIACCAQLSNNQIKYQITYDVPGQKYIVWVVPQYSTPNVNNSNTHEFGGTAQVTLKVPKPFVITNITDINGVWSKTGVKLGNPVTQPNFANQTYDKNFLYCSIGKSPSETDYGPFQAGVPVPLFSFQGTNCTGPVSVLDKGDPFVTAAFNAYSLNVESSFYSRSGQAQGGNVTPLEQFVQKTGPDALCPSLDQKSINLSLAATISNKTPALNDTVSIRVVLKNAGPDTATNVGVQDFIPAGLSLLTKTVTKGTYLNSAWTVGTLAAGDSAVLLLSVKVVTTGAKFYSAEVSQADQTDVNSAPGNAVITEDDFSRLCLSVPVPICTGQQQQLTLTAPTDYINIQWFKNGDPINGATNSMLTVTAIGTYTFTASNATCANGQCCPTVVIDGNCCPVDKCVPLVVKKIKRVI
ncbi:MAG: DUF11 domain-containing protein [Spirosomataceae bacterium]